MIAEISGKAIPVPIDIRHILHFSVVASEIPKAGNIRGKIVGLSQVYTSVDVPVLGLVGIPEWLIGPIQNSHLIEEPISEGSSMQINSDF